MKKQTKWLVVTAALVISAAAVNDLLFHCESTMNVIVDIFLIAYMIWMATGVFTIENTESENDKTQPVTGKVSLNMNHYVYVKINDEGLKLYKEYYTFNGKGPTIEELKEKANLDGYHKLQMWQFAAIYGKHLYNGMQTIFDTTILIEKADLHDVANESLLKKQSV